MLREQLGAALFGLFLALVCWGSLAAVAVLVYREIGSWPS